jgi:phosphatidylserine/phosphatidylglycerophosphate/cardiolipin synthase-like enzyme
VKEDAMATITSAQAICNGEVAYLGWATDPGHVPGLLGFHIVREHLDAAGTIIEERALASYVAFRGQSNPGWLPQNTTVWPVQKYTWRDLSLKRKRNGLQLREDGQRVRYRIAPVGRLKPGMQAVEVIQERGSAYDGTPIPLGYLGDAALTNVVVATTERAPFTATFTNGILSTQFLLRALTPAAGGPIPPGRLVGMLRTPKNNLREYLSGGVLGLVREFFATPGGRFRAALYELDDLELVTLLKTNADRVDLILSDAGASGGAYDTRNAPARAQLVALAEQPGATFTLQHRLFNGSGHIGHNKFVVHLDDQGNPDAVLTGSTNWTWSGVAGQSNNCTRIDEPGIAAAFSTYWDRLHDDALAVPVPFGLRNKVNQSDTLKEDDKTPVGVNLPGNATAEMWFSPNMPGHQQPSTSTKVGPPPDLARLFGLMRLAKQAIFFLVFLPSIGGKTSIVAEAVNLGLNDPTLDVIGAISDPQAMWGKGTGPGGTTPPLFSSGGVSVVQATALADKQIGGELGNFRFGERLAAEKAIIHDKILVIDPLDPDTCVVAFGSHNLGYKASYSNDENLTIVRGHRPLAEAYAAHVLDVYDHYRFRAAQAVDLPVDDSSSRTEPWDGFLSTRDTWQEQSSHRLASYLLSRPPD